MELTYPAAMRELIDHFKNLPGVGRRTAERMALSVFQWDAPRLTAMAETLRTLHERIGSCPVCGNFADADAENGLCAVCSAPGRDQSSICVVETASQIRVIESSGCFRGLYHVLGGRIAPLEGKNPEDLNLDSLEKRLGQSGVKELILALSPDVEGMATSIYLTKRYQPLFPDLRITRPARGLPAGSDLSYADPDTIAVALSGRTGFDKD